MSDLPIDNPEYPSDPKDHTMSHLADIPRFERIDHDLIWSIGCHLVDTCRAAGHPVAISAMFGPQRVFHAALPGSTADNDSWLERKLNVVARFGVPSLDLDDKFRGKWSEFFGMFAVDPSRYAPAGGAVPLLVGDLMVGGLAVSGLASADDHNLAVAALATFSH